MAVDFISHGYDTLPGEGLGELVWQEMFPKIGSATYAVREADDWKVTAVSGADRTVSISAGDGYGLGVIDKTVANDTIQLDPVAGPAGTVRWDLIVCRRDPTPSKGVSEFRAIVGGATPVIPGGRLSGPGIHDQPLALVPVISGQTQPGQIIDLRTWVGDGGGLVAAHDLVRSYMDDVGTRLWINGFDWVRELGDNGTPAWANASELTTAYTFVDSQPNYNFQGTCNVTTLRGGRRRVDVDMTMLRLNTNNSVSPTRQDMGVVLPAAAIGPVNSKIIAAPFSIWTGMVFVQIRPSTGILSFWSQSALTWSENDFVSLNFTYYIPAA